MAYVDGFVLPIPKKKIDAYKKLAKMASKIWKEHGALDYYEAVGEDLKPPFGVPFPKIAKAKKDETVVFAWIVYKSRKHRDAVNKKVMKDPRMNCMDPKDMPFDCKRMTYGGFNIIVKG
jgi:uncharacterized protein YbaA (DUF1428 family)